ncbi:MAG: polyhydroxyalkanoate synthesis repressor PhaR [Gammaproteobacteria bacterium]|nr:polyhydroxyalkanoate synthesis repressor PhaR [Gammaproteobacteria bacterium]
MALSGNSSSCAHDAFRGILLSSKVTPRYCYAQGVGMSDLRVIKKYPNRRLYDTAISCYITLNDVKDLVLTFTAFKVVDAKSGEDLTRSTLLQIIAEQEDKGAPIFNTEILQMVIRYYGDSMQGMMSRYLEQSMQFFVSQQAGKPVSPLAAGNPLGILQQVAETNMALWQSMQRNFFGGAGASNPEPAAAPDEAESK